MRSEIFSNAEQQVAAPGFVRQNSTMLEATVNGDFAGPGFVVGQPSENLGGIGAQNAGAEQGEQGPGGMLGQFLGGR